MEETKVEGWGLFPVGKEVNTEAAAAREAEEEDAMVDSKEMVRVGEVAGKLVDQHRK